MFWGEIRRGDKCMSRNHTEKLSGVDVSMSPITAAARLTVIIIFTVSEAAEL